MDWDSLRQGASFGVLEGVVKAAAGLVVIVAVARAALRWLRFPDRFVDDDTATEPQSQPADGTSPSMPDPNDQDKATREDER